MRRHKQFKRDKETHLWNGMRCGCSGHAVCMRAIKTGSIRVQLHKRCRHKRLCKTHNITRIGSRRMRLK